MPLNIKKEKVDFGKQVVPAKVKIPADFKKDLWSQWSITSAGKSESTFTPSKQIVMPWETEYSLP